MHVIKFHSRVLNLCIIIILFLFIFMSDADADISGNDVRDLLCGNNLDASPSLYDGMIPEHRRNDPSAYDILPIHVRLPASHPFVKQNFPEKGNTCKTPVKPKKCLSAFWWFTNDIRSEVKSAHPEYSLGELSKELARRWLETDELTKKKYEAIAEADKVRYEKEILEFEKNLGIGKHSTEKDIEQEQN